MHAFGSFTDPYAYALERNFMTRAGFRRGSNTSQQARYEYAAATAVVTIVAAFVCAAFVRASLAAVAMIVATVVAAATAGVATASEYVCLWQFYRPLCIRSGT